MLKLFSWSKNAARAEITDAKRIYRKTMTQSRHPAFFKEGYVEDSYDGRMEVLCMHLSIILYALRDHGENGKKLSQALYDVMIDDFDIALREEGLSDTGVARRIKPLAKMFFGRAKVYAEALDSGGSDLLTEFAGKFIGTDSDKLGDNVEKIVRYTEAYSQEVAGKTIGEIAKGKFSYPNFT